MATIADWPQQKSQAGRTRGAGDELGELQARKFAALRLVDHVEKRRWRSCPEQNLRDGTEGSEIK